MNTPQERRCRGYTMAREPKTDPGLFTILVAEDDPGIRFFLWQTLRSAGYNVFSAQNGEEAVRLAAGYQAQIHVLLSDIEMPVMNGVEAAKILCGLRACLHVLFMSDVRRGAGHQRPLAKKEIPYLAKPFTREELLEKVRSILWIDQNLPYDHCARCASFDAVARRTA